MKREHILKIAMIVPIFLDLICLLFLPVQVPIHYSMNLQVSAYGSKYVLLILGSITLIFGIGMSLLYKVCKKTEQEKLVFVLGIAVLDIFNILNIFALVGAFVFS